MRRFLLFLPVFLLISSLSIKKSGWFTGTWEGTGLQPSAGNETWTIRAILIPSSDSFRIEYPSLNCSGNWSLVQYDAHAAEFREVITEGKQYCVEKGTVVLAKVDKDHISYSYYQGESANVDAYATLTRVK